MRLCVRLLLLLKLVTIFTTQMTSAEVDDELDIVRYLLLYSITWEQKVSILSM